MLEVLRINKTPYWRLYESSNKRTSGNFIDTADFTDADLDVSLSVENLRKALERLSTGTYILTAYTSKDKSKGGIDTVIEVEGSHSHSSHVAAIGAVTNDFVVEGIGRVTAENFESVLEAKFKAMQEQARKEQELASLKAEVTNLKKQVEENETGFNKGVMGIGSVLYDIVKSTPSGKEFIGMAAKALFGAKAPSAPATQLAGTDSPSGAGAGEDDENRVTNALERLASNNPDFIGQLEKLAHLKETDPGTFEVAVSSLDGL